MGSDGRLDQVSGSDVVKRLQSFSANKRKCQGQGFFATESSYVNRFQRLNNSDGVKHCSMSAAQTSSDCIMQCALNRIIRSRIITSLRSLMALKKGRARRSKHDDTTTSVVDLSGFVQVSTEFRRMNATDLGRMQHVFSDKTGKSTENVMRHKI